MNEKLYIGKTKAEFIEQLKNNYPHTPTPGPEPVPTAPNGKVLYRTTAGGEWFKDDAVISDGTFIGFANKSNAVEVIIPSKDSSGYDVTQIERNVFDGCSKLKSVVIPDNVTNIGENAFYHCSGLMNVIIPDSVESIGNWAFGYCHALTNVVIGSGVMNIGADTFFDCTSVTDVYCWPNPANLAWNEDAYDDFKSDGSTVCHVKAEYYDAYVAKFTNVVHVTFADDLA